MMATIKHNLQTKIRKIINQIRFSNKMNLVCSFKDLDFSKWRTMWNRIISIVKIE